MSRIKMTFPSAADKELLPKRSAMGCIPLFKAYDLVPACRLAACVRALALASEDSVGILNDFDRLLLMDDLICDFDQLGHVRVSTTPGPTKGTS